MVGQIRCQNEVLKSQSGHSEFTSVQTGGANTMIGEFGAHESTNYAGGAITVIHYYNGFCRSLKMRLKVQTIRRTS